MWTLEVAQKKGYAMTEPDPIGLTIHALGNFEVVRADDITPVFRSQKTKWLLAYLVLQRGRAAEFRRLKDLFWPDTGTNQVTATTDAKRSANEFANLRQSLTNLRDLLSDQRILKPTRHSVQLDLRTMAVDVYAFDDAIADNTDVSLRRAVLCYQGDLLADCGEAWAQAEREKRRQEYLYALKTVAQNALADGDVVETERLLRLLIAAEPAREEWTENLVRLLINRGEAAMARKACEQHLALLSTPKLKQQSAAQKLYLTLLSTPTPSSSEQPSLGSADAAVSYGALPHPMVPLIGRESAVAEILARLVFVPMVTLQGPPGTGKTQLALHVCAASRSEYPDGTPFIDLTAAKNLPDVIRELRHRLHIPQSRDLSAQEALIEFLASRRILLTLDNCAHVVEAITDLIKTLLRSCPRLRLLTTTQLAWRDISAQSIYHVRGLSTPDPDQLPRIAAEPEALQQVDAVRLFLREAANVQPDIALTPQNAVAIAQICTHLDGLPLGITLAAAQAQLYSPAEILESILSGPQGFPSPDVGLLPHQAGLWAAINSTLARLSAGQQHTFAALSVFRGGWTVAAAEAVVGTKQMRDDLKRLIDWSLITSSSLASGLEQDALRFRMLEMLRRHAAERLRLAGMTDTARHRHLDYYLRLAEEADAGLNAGDQDRILDRLEGEWENLQGAMEWAAMGGQAEQGLRLACALRKYWYVRGDNQVGAAWLEKFLAACPDVSPDLRRLALLVTGNLAFYRADFERASACYQEQLALADSPVDRARAYGSLGNISMLTGDLAGAECHFQRAQEIFEAIHDERGLAHTYGNLAILAFETNNPDMALHYHRSTVAAFERSGDIDNVIMALNNLGATQVNLRQRSELVATLRRSFSLCVEMDHRPGLVHCLFLHACLAVEVGMMEVAAQFLGAARGFRERNGLPMHSDAAAEQRRYCGIIQAQIGTANLDCAMDEGRAMPVPRLLAAAADLYARAASEDQP
jgi:predicted ATPase/DNA-binding SARP family transcriptional activator